MGDRECVLMMALTADGHLRHDAAIDRWAAMRENVYQHFKFTPKATRSVVAWGLVFPAICAYSFWKSDAKFDWAGKRKDESLMAAK